MRRRDFIGGIGSVAVWPIVARAQQRALPVVGFVHLGLAAAMADNARAFRMGLSEAGFIESRNVTVEYHWLGGQIDRVPALVADLVRRRVAVIVANGNVIALAAKAATATIPVVFAVGEDPVKLGLVANLARPGGNLTGINFYDTEVVTKQLGLLHAMVPKAVRVAVLANPTLGPEIDHEVRDLQEAARVIGLQIHVLNASTSREIDAAFETIEQERFDALLVLNDAFFGSQVPQFVTLTARERIPAAFATVGAVAAGGLMSYGTNFKDTHRQIGVYTGSILKGTKPADLPVVQSTRFELAINLQTARLLGIEVPPTLLAIADQVID